jgi:hypothetical protein
MSSSLARALRTAGLAAARRDPQLHVVENEPTELLAARQAIASIQPPAAMRQALDQLEAARQIRRQRQAELDALIRQTILPTAAAR